MDRRNALKTLGTVAGLAVGSQSLEGAEHGEKANMVPLEGMHLYLCAFHIAKKDPKFAVEAHHYCSPVNDEVHQCVIFDGNGKNARILGVEYIISDKLYRSLPDAEKKFYHPHTYEIISGQLIAPALPAAKEKELMKGLLLTWGKTWHTWPDPKTALPMGEPLLMWAATKDGQISANLLAGRDKLLKISTPEIRKRRSYLGPVPQVDPPKSVDSLGRQWTNQGPDKPKGKQH